jgi:two-component system OmpR family sensor kinase
VPSLIHRTLAGARTRILAAFVVLLAFSTLLSVVAIYELLSVRTSDRVDAALTQEVDEFRQLAGGKDPDTGRPFGQNARAIFELYFDRNVPGEGEVVMALLGDEVVGIKSRVGALNPRIEAQAGRWVNLQRSESGELEASGDAIRYLAVPVEGERGVRGVFVVAAAMSGERDEVNDAVRLAAIVLVSVLLIASGLAWIVAGRVLAPVRLLTDTARSIGETDLTRRIPASGNDEIAELARTFNDMLDRLEAAFSSQRAFVSDASHELRTPITIVRGHLELLGDDPDERRETIAMLTDELDRMSRFVDDLLLLARAELDDFLRVDALELGALSDELLEKAVALGDRDWRLEARGEAVIVADRHRLTQAVMGFAQNAVQHTGAGDAIHIGTAVRAREAWLWVRDSGPGIPFEDQRRIFERFARASASRRRSDGAGLGLAIARAIAEAHGGRVELSSRPGAGAMFAVVIPVDRVAANGAAQSWSSAPSPPVAAPPASPTPSSSPPPSSPPSSSPPSSSSPAGGGVATGEGADAGG